MPELAPNDPIIKAYLNDIQHLKSDQRVLHQQGLEDHSKPAGQTARKHGWTLVPELATYSSGKRVVPDGTVCDELQLARGS
jgi:hypothetical protein